MGQRLTLSKLWLRRSITRFVAVFTLLGLLAIYAADGWFTYQRSVDAHQQQQDRALSRVTLAYLRALETDALDVPSVTARVYQEETGVVTPPRLRFRVTDSTGKLLAGEPDLTSAPSSLWANSARPDQVILYDDRFRGDPVRVTALRGQLARAGLNQAVIVQVIEPYGSRLAAQGEILFDTLWRASFRLVAAVILVGLLLLLAFRPLRALGRELAGRQADDHSPLHVDRPEELRPMVDAMNRLLSTQQATAEQQHKFLADASHQLRTPLAVLRTQLQGLVSGQLNVAETLPKMLRTVERSTNLANQLLSLAKVEQIARQADWQAVDLDAIARDVALEFAPLMARKRLDFSLESVPAVLQSDVWLLGELLRNLLSNAIHHSPKSAPLGIVVRCLRGEVELIVWDRGGGVSESVLGRLFEPFSASSGGTGIGLGLSICRQIAESMQASVHLFNRMEAGRVIGVDAVVRWPRTLAVSSTNDPLATAKVADLAGATTPLRQVSAQVFAFARPGACRAVWPPSRARHTT